MHLSVRVVTKTNAPTLTQNANAPTFPENKMKEQVQKNINTLNAQVNECRMNGKYCDVDFIVENTTFQCHRLILGAASSYFDAMFCSNFKERTATTIALPEIEADVFQTVLQYIYTGDVAISDTNLFNMVRASVFYKLDGLEELCAQQIAKNVGPPIENVFDILAFARTFAKTKLLNVSCEYVRKHLDYFSKIDKFLDVSFEDLSAVLLVSLPSQNQSILMNAIVRWTQRGTSHSSEERKQHFNELLEKFNFAKISPEYTKYLIKSLINNAESAEASGSGSSAIPRSLYLYIRSADTKSAVTNVFTFHKHEEEFTGELSCEVNLTFDFVRSIAVDDRLYSLGYSGEFPASENRPTTVFTPDRVFRYSEAVRRARQLQSSAERHQALHRAQQLATHRVQQLVSQLAEISQNAYSAKRQKMSGNPTQTFCASSSASLFVSAHLRPPPLFLNRFEICRIDQYIYVYDRNAASRVVRNSDKSSLSNLCFNDEEVARGIYAYNRNTDQWQPLPSLMQKRANACMTSDDRMVYLIGGTEGRQLVQALDHRTGQWQVLAPTSGSYENAACCVHEGKIHVCMNLNGCCFSEVYDPVAGKWDNFVSSPDPNANGFNNQQLFSYKGSLVTVFEDRSNAVVRFAEYKERKWSSLTSVSNAIRKVEFLNEKKHSLVDAVLFRPYGM